ncbi:protein phosphatase 1D [Tribolium madens]|uniref:protein phosphatase 1D n=1 Tax=Tribolium madens TaxID=41895 RepID=UPI001CF74A78|nr:protein phosphatase 1D [Tribolium madens]
MPASIGVNLRVTGHCRQGGRKYMEDFFSVAYQQTEDERDLEYAFFGIYDGHGGAEAAAFAKEHLMETIIKHKTFWSDNDEDVLRAIKDGYIATHYAMWKEQEKWPRTASGLPSTAGTTASVAFIRRGKVYIGHVGDSGIILGYQEEGSTEWRAKPLTRDHKPENLDEMTRINQCGGKVVSKSGVPRVVWNRPKMGHQGPVRRSTPIDEIPFLAVARSLGDLWSYNSQINQFIVSPDPDCAVFTIDTSIHRCLVFGTDGLFNMLSPQNAVHIVQQAERHNENAALSDSINKTWLNPSKLLVEKALERWHNTKMRADNTSVVTLMLDPPGPPRAQVLKNRKKNAYPDSGLEIMTRYEEIVTKLKEGEGSDDHVTAPPTLSTNEDAEASSVTSSEVTSNCFPLKERNFASKPRESTSFDPKEVEDKENKDESIQINEISSSSNECDENSNETPIHNLRSGSKGRVVKKCDDGLTKLRKSSRLAHEKKTASALKGKLTLAQRILRSKKISIKKKVQVAKKRLIKAKTSTKKSARKSLRISTTKGVKSKSPPKSMPKRSDVQKNRNRRLPRKN